MADQSGVEFVGLIETVPAPQVAQSDVLEGVVDVFFVQCDDAWKGDDHRLAVEGVAEEAFGVRLEIFQKGRYGCDVGRGSIAQPFAESSHGLARHVLNEFGECAVWWAGRRLSVTQGNRRRAGVNGRIHAFEM